MTLSSFSRTRATVSPTSAGLEIGHGQGEQVSEQPRAQFDVDAVGGVCEEIGPKAAQHDLEHGEGHHAAGQDLQGRIAPVDEHLCQR